MPLLRKQDPDRLNECLGKMLGIIEIANEEGRYAEGAGRTPESDQP
jgi:hypothetical protein